MLAGRPQNAQEKEKGSILVNAELVNKQKKVPVHPSGSRQEKAQR